MGDINITIEGGSTLKSNESTKRSGKEKEDTLPSFTESPSAPPPDWVQKAISAHQSGKGMVPMFVEKNLAKDLQKYYAGHGLVAAHDPEEHGPFGHTLPEEQNA